MSGYIYCLSNVTMPGIYKIGFTTREITSRLIELNKPATYRRCDDIFELEFAKKVDNCRQVERLIHTELGEMGARVYPNREFFRESISVIKNLFDKYDGDWGDDDKCIDIVIKNVDKLPEPSPKEPEYDEEPEEEPEEESKELSNTISNNSTCCVCFKTYKSKQSYQNHRCKIKNNSLDCKFCRKNFSNKYHRERHETKCSKSVIAIQLQEIRDTLEKLEKRHIYK